MLFIGLFLQYIVWFILCSVLNEIEGESLAKRSGVKHWRDGGHSSLQRDLSALRGAVYRTLSAIHGVVYINEVWRRIPCETDWCQELESRRK